jgi:hypothetical protein
MTLSFGLVKVMKLGSEYPVSDLNKTKKSASQMDCAFLYEDIESITWE